MANTTAKKRSVTVAAKARNKKTAQAKKKKDTEPAPSQTAPDSAPSKKRPQPKPIGKAAKKRVPKNTSSDLSPDQETSVAAILAGMASSRQVCHRTSRTSSPLDEDDQEPQGLMSDEEDEVDHDEGEDDEVEDSEQAEEDEPVEEAGSESDYQYFSKKTAQMEKGILFRESPMQQVMLTIVIRHRNGSH